MDEHGDAEHRGERRAERGEAAGRQREPAGGGAEQVAELVGGRAHRHHGDRVLGSGVHAERTGDHRTPAVDERHRREDGEREGRGRPHSPEHEHRAALDRGQAGQQRGRRARGAAAAGEGAGHHRDRARAEPEPDDRRRHVVATQQQRAGVREHARPRGVRQQLAEREARDVGVPPGGGGGARPPRWGVCGAQADEHQRDECRHGGDGEPRDAPAGLGDGADDRHADDPRRRHADDCPREHVRALLWRRPLARRGNADGHQ